MQYIHMYILYVYICTYVHTYVYLCILYAQLFTRCIHVCAYSIFPYVLLFCMYFSICTYVLCCSCVFNRCTVCTVNRYGIPAHVPSSYIWQSGLLFAIVYPLVCMCVRILPCVHTCKFPVTDRMRGKDL